MISRMMPCERRYPLISESMISSGFLAAERGYTSPIAPKMTEEGSLVAERLPLHLAGGALAA